MEKIYKVDASYAGLKRLYRFVFYFTVQSRPCIIIIIII